MRLLLMSALGYIAQTFSVQAHVMCKRIEQLPIVSDEQTLSLFETYIKDFASSQALLLRQIDKRFHIAARPGDENCGKDSTCYYRFLDFHKGEFAEKFASSGTGWILLFSNGMYHPYFQDH